MSVGEIGLKARRPSVAGQNTQIIFNKGGVEGANANLVYDYGNNTVTVNAQLTLNTSYQYQFPLAIPASRDRGGIQIFPTDAGNTAGLVFANANGMRWFIGKDGTTEGGSNVGSNLAIVQLGDNGATIGTAIAIDRLTGNVTLTSNIKGVVNTFTGNLSVTQNTTAGNISTANINVTSFGNVTNFGVYDGGSIIIAGVANLNFTDNATGTFGVVTANGSNQANITIGLNAAQIAINTAPMISPHMYNYFGGV